MGQTLTEQISLFAGAMVLGSAIGLLFDLFDCLGPQKRCLRRSLADAMFCIAAMALILLFLLIHTQGILRSYLIVGGLLGFGAEHVCLRPPLVSALRWLGPRVRFVLQHGRDAFFWLFSFPRGQ